MTAYAYTYQDQISQELWFASESSFASNTSGSPTYTNAINYAYFTNGELNTAADAYSSGSGLTGDNSSFTFAVNELGWITSVDNKGSLSGGTPGVPRVVLAAQYDLNGNRTALASTITQSGGSAMTDFQDRETFDTLNRQTSVVQAQQTSTSSRNAASRIIRGIQYDSDGRLTGINDYDDSTPPIVQGNRTYDHAGRLTGISWSGAGSGGGSGGGSGSGSGSGSSSTTFDQFTWGYDNDSHITSYSNSVYSSENKSYSYYNDGQLHTDGSTTFNWGLNGNPSSGSYVTGPGNRLLADGTYTYTYDDNGNMLTQASSTHRTEYTWDQRNRLITVKDFSISGGTSTQTSRVDYNYDVFDRLQGRTYTPYTSGSAGTPQTARFVYDFPSPGFDSLIAPSPLSGNPPQNKSEMLVAFNGSGGLTDRYLWGAAVDEILADEQFTPSGSQLPTAEGTILWACTDNLGTVRDLVSSTGLVDHLVLDAFGNRTWQCNSSASERFGYTGAFYDPITTLLHDGARWYKPSIERWLSQDPSGLGPDSNPYRYVGNSPTNHTDPRGLAPTDDKDTKPFMLGEPGKLSKMTGFTIGAMNGTIGSDSSTELNYPASQYDYDQTVGIGEKTEVAFVGAMLKVVDKDKDKPANMNGGVRVWASAGKLAGFSWHHAARQGAKDEPQTSENTGDPSIPEHIDVWYMDHDEIYPTKKDPFYDHPGFDAAWYQSKMADDDVVVKHTSYIVAILCRTGTGATAKLEPHPIESFTYTVTIRITKDSVDVKVGFGMVYKGYTGNGSNLDWSKLKLKPNGASAPKMID